ALPSKTRNPDHQSTCETRIEHRGSRSRFLNFARVSVIETPTPPSRGYTVTMLSCGMPFRLNEVRTPCGLSWRNCSICGGSGVGMRALLVGGILSDPSGFLDNAGRRAQFSASTNVCVVHRIEDRAGGGNHAMREVPARRVGDPGRRGVLLVARRRHR